MSKRALLLLILAGMFASQASIAANEDATPQPNAAVQAEEARRAGLKNKFETFLDETVKLRNANQFEQADAILNKECVAILDELGDSAAPLREKLAFYQNELRDVWASYNVNIAEDLITEQKFEDAAAYLRRANEIAPSRYITKRIQNIEERLKSIRFDEATSLENIYPDPDWHNGRTFEDDQRSFQTKIGQMKTYMKNRRFKEAIECGEEAYKIHNTNTEIPRLLEVCYTEVNQAMKQAAFVEQQRLMAQVDNSKFRNSPNRDETVRDVVAERTTTENVDFSQARDDINKILFPEIEFDELPLQQVLDQLSLLANENPSNNTEIQIIRKISQKRLNEINVKLHLKNVSMLDVIKYIAITANLDYKVESIGSRPVIYIGDVMSKIETRRFAIPETLVESIVSDHGSETPEGEDAEGDFGDALESGTRRKPEGNRAKRKKQIQTAFKNYFIECGVEFTDSSMLVYDPKADEQLAVTNTTENLDFINSLLRQLIRTSDMEATMISIESKFLEVRQSMLEQLGFHWSITKLMSLAVDPTNPGLAEYVEGQSTNQILQSDNILNAAKTFLTSDPLYNPSQSIFSSTILPNIGPDKNINLNLSITALNQKDISEALSAPKVTTMHGEAATLYMVRNEYYPERWDPPRFTNNDVGVTLEPAFPRFPADPKEIGIILRVTPTVSNDNVINLELEPEVTEFKEWTKYYYQVTIPGNNTATEEEIRMPEIASRKYRTNVGVYDGETAVLGGVIEERSSLVQAKYPILGDIPLVGRLFRDYRNESAKTNLIIFVTARTLKTNGEPWEEMQSLGVHDFKY